MLREKVKLHNRFDFEIYDTETGEITKAHAENIVLNQMYTRICGSQSYFSQIGVGTGSGTLSAARTTLFSYLAYKVATAVETIYDTATTAHITKKAVFNAEDAIGVWTEVGIMYSTSSATFVTHALIKDAEGNPITINKTSTKVITVYATVYVEVIAPTSGNNCPITLDQGVSALLDNGFRTSYFFFMSALKCVDGSASNLAAICQGAVSVAWYSDAGNKRSYTNLCRFGINEGNQDTRGVYLFSLFSMGVGSCSIPLSGKFEGYTFTGVAVATGDGVTKEFDLPKDLIVPLSDVIKVGGVTMVRGVDYTIHYGVKSTTTTLVNTPDTRKQFTILAETIILPQPPDAYFADGAAIVTSIVMKSTQYSSGKTYKIELSEDNINWITAGSGTFSNSQVVTMNTFTPAKYKYMRASGTATEINYIKINCTPPIAQKQIKFITPPANASAITADFTVDYIPKSVNFVLDVQAEILFGEVV